MKVTVTQQEVPGGVNFIAHDENGVQITDRAILEQIAFEPFIGTGYVNNIQVDNNTDNAIITPIDININTTLHKR
tara:strand:- start:593 stop:817 length:225 start_codon:yes stop_codon:yes gene_type:complete